jgi:hypothetical protein
VKIGIALRIQKTGPKTYVVSWLTDEHRLASKQFASARKAYEFVRWMKEEEQLINQLRQMIG